MPRKPKKIDLTLLDVLLKELVMSGSKMFPISRFEDLPTTKSSNYYKIMLGDHKNEVYAWDDDAEGYVLIGIDITEVDWENVLNAPTEFTPEPHEHIKKEIVDFEHTHGIEDISGLEIYPKADEVDSKIDNLQEQIDNKIDADEAMGLSQENFTTELKDRLENMAGGYEALEDLIDEHKSSSDHDNRYYTEAEIDNKLASKADTTIVNAKLSKVIFDMHNLDTVRHITAEERQKLVDLGYAVDNIELTPGPQGDSAYSVLLVSTQGNVFKNGIVSTTIKAFVFYGAEDVTDKIDANRFRWTRTSEDSMGDIIWNDRNFGGKKEIEVTEDDVFKKATFTCTILK